MSRLSVKGFVSEILWIISNKYMKEPKNRKEIYSTKRASLSMSVCTVLMLGNVDLIPSKAIHSPLDVMQLCWYIQIPRLKTRQTNLYNRVCCTGNLPPLIKKPNYFYCELYIGIHAHS